MTKPRFQISFGDSKGGGRSEEGGYVYTKGRGCGKGGRGCIKRNHPPGLVRIRRMWRVFISTSIRIEKDGNSGESNGRKGEWVDKQAPKG